MRQQELQDDEERMQKRHELSTSNADTTVEDGEDSPAAGRILHHFGVLYL